MMRSSVYTLAPFLQIYRGRRWRRAAWPIAYPRLVQTVHMAEGDSAAALHGIGPIALALIAMCLLRTINLGAVARTQPDLLSGISRQSEHSYDAVRQIAPHGCQACALARFGSWYGDDSGSGRAGRDPCR
ncbi:MAG: hypothetical protein MI924_18215 [Chloroflexales bacterium]|nr:hypothetical protein [Chloroflexales bacterium]